MSRRKMIIRRVLAGVLFVGAAIYLHRNTEFIEAPFNEPGYVLNGDPQTGFMRINTDTGKTSLCVLETGQSARCLQWIE